MKPRGSFVPKIVAFRPSMKVKQILGDLPPEAANQSDWIEYLIQTGHEVLKYGKEQVLNNSPKFSLEKGSKLSLANLRLVSSEEFQGYPIEVFVKV